MRRPDRTIDPDTAAELEAVDAALRGEGVASEHAELAELSRLVADERPAPRAEWARELDAKVAAGFPRPGGGRRRGGRGRLPVPTSLWMPGLAAAACALVALAVVASALSGGGGGTDSGSGSTSSGGSSAPARPEAATPSANGSPERNGAPPAAAQATAPDASLKSAPAAGASPFRGRRVERATQLTLAVGRTKMQATAQRVYSVAGTYDGIVDSASVSSGDATSAGASFELRFPSSRAAEAVARLAELGKVRSQTSTAQDVTATFRSADERLRAALAERSGLLRALGRADTANKIDSLKRRLAIVQREIGAARSGLARVRARVDYARVSLRLEQRNREIVAPPNDDGWDPGDALHDAGRVLAVSAGVALIALAVLVPLSVLGLLGWAASRTTRRRRREAALGAS
jgi:uncharacterized protein DUF4349